MNKIQIIKKMLEVNPSNGEAWYLLGMEYLENNQINEAWEAFGEAIIFLDQSGQQKVFEELAKISDKNPKLNGRPIESKVDEISDVVSLDNPIEQEIFDESLEGSSNEEMEFFEEVEERDVLPFKVISGKKKKTSNIIENKIIKTVTFDDVGGLDGLKETINMKIVRPFVNPTLFSKYKKKIGGGILLYGPPGCGKTFIAKATAGECKAKFIPVHITDILSPYMGVSSQNLKDIFAKARAQKPSILFFDEIDSIGYNRSKSDSEMMRPVVDQLLTEIEGIDSNTEKLLIIAATNLPWDVDPALKRPGRFDKSVFILPPDQEARKCIFQLKLLDKPIENIDYNILAKNSELYSGADIENVIELATETVIGEILRTGVERPIGMQDIIEAIDNTKPTTLEWLKTVRNYVKYANQSGYYDEVEKYLSKIRKLI